jgi:SAM-dependent methyltransferase
MHNWNGLEVPSVAKIGDFMSQLESARENMDADSWRTLIQKDRHLRQWRYFLVSDPYTRWGLLKPRGYPGDATLMDFAYGHESIQNEVQGAGLQGQAVYEVTKAAKQSESARQRIELIANQVSELAKYKSSLSAVSFASGHGREFQKIDPEIRHKIVLSAIDQDPHSLEELEQSLVGMKLNLVNQNILRDEFGYVEPADFAYSLGLFDYLDTVYAKTVLKRMWKLTKPGGRLLFANLSTNAANLGYCEAIMDWWMIARSIQEMRHLGESLGQFGGIKNIEVVEQGCFYYVFIDKNF